MKKTVMAAAAAALAAVAAFAEDAYIESDGNLRFNTGYFIGANTKLELDFQLGDNPSGNPALMGVLNHDEAYGTNEVNLTVYLGGNSGNRWLNVFGRSSNGDKSNANLCQIDGNRHTLVVDLPSKDGSGEPYDQFRLLDENGVPEYNSGSTVRNWVTNALVTAENAVAGLPLGLFARCDTKWAGVQSDFTMASAAQMKV